MPLTSLRLMSKDESDLVVTYVEELPAALAEGESVDEARKNLREAIFMILGSQSSDHGRAIFRVFSPPLLCVLDRARLLLGSLSALSGRRYRVVCRRCEW